MTEFTRLKVGIIIFDEMDLLDATGPVEVFNAVRKKSTENQENDPILSLYDTESLFNTKYISLHNKEIVTTSDGTKIVADEMGNQVDLNQFRIFVIPGGKGVHKLRKNKKDIEFIKNAIHNAFISLSVCTGAYIVAETGYLDKEIVATHWRHLDLFQEEFPDIKLANNAQYMDGHKVVTTGGVTAGIDGALYIVKNLISDEAAHDAANLINYKWMG